MNNEPSLTKEDFSGCGWKAILSEAKPKHYTAMSLAFGKAANEAEGEGQQARSKVLRLLSTACSRELHSEQQKANKKQKGPVLPFMLISSRSGCDIIDSLSEEDVSLLADIASEVDDPHLRARLADLVSIKRYNKGGHRFALMAIDAYRKIPLKIGEWHPVYECWDRAIGLAKGVSRGDRENRLAQIESAIIETLLSDEGEDEERGLFRFNLSNLLKSYDLGGDRALDIAQKMESIGRGFVEQDSFLTAHHYLEASVYWHTSPSRDSDPPELVALKVYWAESRVKEAEQMLSSSHSNLAVVASRYHQAVEIYNSISNAHKEEHQLNERIGELTRLYYDTNKKYAREIAGNSMAEDVMTIDVGPEAESSRNAVKGKPPAEAFRAFVGIYGVSVEDLKRQAIDSCQQFIAPRLFPTTHMSQDGRIIGGHSGGFDFSSGQQVLYEMIQGYLGVNVSYGMDGFILPALEALRSEHSPQEARFVELAKLSSFVGPTGREQLVGKALHAGYNHDFTTALHILIPQFEYMVRFHLREMGADVVNQEDGIEVPYGLNKLIKDNEEKIEGLFGKDLSFEIQALFCHRVGANLRNNLAHGDMSYEACHSYPAVYAWWLVLKIVVLYINLAREGREEVSERDQEA